MQYLVAFALLVISQFSLAITPFQKHIVHTAQAFSSFNMYELSEGDPSLLIEYEKQMSLATAELQASNQDQKQAFLTRWVALKPLLKYNDQPEHGIFYDARVRFIARTYLTDIYVAHNKEAGKVPTISARMANLQILTVVMASREIDLGGDRFAGLAISDHNAQLDTHKILEEIDHSLTTLLAMKLSKDQQKALRKVKTRVSFIGKGITNKQAAVPFFLVYSSVQSIEKLLGSVL